VALGAISVRRRAEGAAVTTIFLDGRLTRQMSAGMKAYARELCRRLPQAAPDLQFAIFRRGDNFGIDEQARLPAAIARARPALVHFLSLYAPLLRRRPYAVTIHDLIHLRYPQYFKAKVGPYYRFVVRSLCAGAARIIVDDARTTSDLQRFLGVDPANVRVVELGAADPFFGEVVPRETSRPYILYAGNRREHKDLRTLFTAWAGLPAEMSLDLYLTGTDDASAARREFQRTYGSIVALGDVSEADLASYYAGAIALVHPALWEGFGLPMLEAMAAGCPVIACEDAVPGALRAQALTFPARNAEAARSAIARIASSEELRRRLSGEGRTRAREFTWERCARRTADVYREILREHAA
jgi:glycosyltransferase involved in cell wall biosynthesis